MQGASGTPFKRRLMKRALSGILVGAGMAALGMVTGSKGWPDAVTAPSVQERGFPMSPHIISPQP